MRSGLLWAIYFVVDDVECDTDCLLGGLDVRGASDLQASNSTRSRSFPQVAPPAPTQAPDWPAPLKATGARGRINLGRKTRGLSEGRGPDASAPAPRISATYWKLTSRVLPRQTRWAGTTHIQHLEQGHNITTRSAARMVFHPDLWQSPNSEVPPMQPATCHLRLGQHTTVARMASRPTISQGPA